MLIKVSNPVVFLSADTPETKQDLRSRIFIAYALAFQCLFFISKIKHVLDRTFVM